MKTILPAIERVTIPDKFPSMAAKDWAVITGEDPGFKARSYYYRSLDDGMEYQEIVGGFAPPAKKAGFAVVVGLGRDEDLLIDPSWNLGTKRIKVLAEIEADGLVDMVAGLLSMRKIFSPALDKGFYCDGDEALSFRIGQIMAKMEDEPFLVMIPGLYSHQSATAFKDYMSIFHLYRKVLDRGKCQKVRDYMQAFPRESLDLRGEKAWEDYPVMAAMAYAVHGLMLNPMLDADEGAIEEEEAA